MRVRARTSFGTLALAILVAVVGVLVLAIGLGERAFHGDEIVTDAFLLVRGVATLSGSTSTFAGIKLVAATATTFTISVAD